MFEDLGRIAPSCRTWWKSSMSRRTAQRRTRKGCRTLRSLTLKATRNKRKVSVYECGRGSKYMKMLGKCSGPKYLSEKIGKWGQRRRRGHDLGRRMDRQGEILIWCRKCSGYARQRMGPKLMNCCKPEQVGTKGHGQMLKRIQVLEDGRVLAKEAHIEQ